MLVGPASTSSSYSLSRTLLCSICENYQETGRPNVDIVTPAARQNAPGIEHANHLQDHCDHVQQVSELAPVPEPLLIERCSGGRQKFVYLLSGEGCLSILRWADWLRAIALVTLCLPSFETKLMCK